MKNRGLLLSIISCVKVQEKKMVGILEAAKIGNLAGVQTCIEKGVDINIENNDGSTALMVAGKLEIVKYLVENGADINATDDDGWSALINAFRYGYLEIVKYLIENGAKINIQDDDGKTALDIAITEDRYTEVIEYLESLK